MSDDDFEPRLGRIRSQGGGKTRRYLGRVLAAATLAGNGGKAHAARFDGSRIGRGASKARIAASGGRRSRRVVIKTRLVRLGAKGLGASRAHLHYIQRDGVTRDGAPGTLYDAEIDGADGKAFLDRAAGDRHQFRFIVSAEDGAEYPDLKPFVRRLMIQMEADLGTRLDWVAVDHFNTGHPHTHIMLRGIDDHGQNLVIARDYIANGMRARAEQLVTLDLGPRTAQEIEARLRLDIDAERLTATDRQLLRDIGPDRIVSASARDPFTQSLRAGRLQKLSDLGLAQDVGGGRWRLDETIETALRAIGERGDIIRTMQRDLSARMGTGAATEQAIFDPSTAGSAPLIGRVITRGLADELGDRHYLLVDGVDGRTHYVALGQGDGVAPLAEGSVVRIEATEAGARAVDHTVADIARAHDGIYSVDIHLRHDPNASEAFVTAHVRRLEAIRRATGDVERLPDGRWQIAEDHVARAMAYEARLQRDRPVAVTMLTDRPLGALIHADGAGWLDRTIAGVESVAARDQGFGREIRTAQAQRRQWLIEQDLATGEGTAFRARRDMIALLTRRELLRVGATLAKESGLAFSETGNGDTVQGVIRRRINLVSGQYALVERSRDFTLVPWRPVLERQIGKAASGILRGGDVRWSFGRDRNGPTLG